MSAPLSASSRLLWGRGAEMKEGPMSCSHVGARLAQSSSRHGHNPGLGSPNWGKAMLVLEDDGPSVYTEAPKCLRLPSSFS